MAKHKCGFANARSSRMGPVNFTMWMIIDILLYHLPIMLTTFSAWPNQTIWTKFNKVSERVTDKARQRSDLGPCTWWWCAETSLLHNFFSPSGSFWPADGRIRKTKKLISPFCSPLPPPTLVSWPALSFQPHSVAKTSIYVKQLFSPPQPSNLQRQQLLYVSTHGI